MIWDAFCESGMSSLAFFNEKRNATMYTKTIKQFLIYFAKESYYSLRTFQQDNASVHSAKKSKQ